MKTIVDVICMRCFNAESSQGLDPGDAIANFRTSHVCPDGVRAEFQSPFEQKIRRVPGPGERTKLPEEKQS